MIKVELDETEVKKAVTSYVARKFQISPDSIERVTIDYQDHAVVTINGGDEEDA